MKGLSGSVEDGRSARAATARRMSLSFTSEDGDDLPCTILKADIHMGKGRAISFVGIQDDFREILHRNPFMFSGQPCLEFLEAISVQPRKI